ncbi:MAG TPA: hypothetical protein VGN26_12890 [Armatimonadota bacterium]|jgi:hypothetical protein
MGARRRLGLAMVLATFLLAGSQRQASAVVWFHPFYRWFTQGAGYPNGPLELDVVQWSHVAQDGWTSTSDACVRRNWGAWNGYCDYCI